MRALLNLIWYIVKTLLLSVLPLKIELSSKSLQTFLDSMLCGVSSENSFLDYLLWAFGVELKPLALCWSAWVQLLAVPWLPVS